MNRVQNEVSKVSHEEQQHRLIKKAMQRNPDKVEVIEL